MVLAILMFIIFIVKLEKSVKSQNKSRGNKILTIIVFIISICFAFISITIFQFNYQLRRRLCIESLQEMSKRQRQHYNLYKHYAKTFKDIGCSGYNIPQCLKINSYSFYMDNDKIYHPWSAGLIKIPNSVNMKSNRIYAIGRVRNDIEKLDILSIDYEGNLMVIQSQLWWLPYN